MRGGIMWPLVTVARRARSHADRTAIVFGVIPLVRDRNKTSTAYAPPSTTSGAPQPMSTVATKASVSAPAPVAASQGARHTHLESRRGIGLRGVFLSLLPFVAAVLTFIIGGSLTGQGFNGPLAWLGILVVFLVPVPFFTIVPGCEISNWR